MLVLAFFIAFLAPLSTAVAECSPLANRLVFTSVKKSVGSWCAFYVTLWLDLVVGSRVKLK